MISVEIPVNGQKAIPGFVTYENFGAAAGAYTPGSTNLTDENSASAMSIDNGAVLQLAGPEVFERKVMRGNEVMKTRSGAEVHQTVLLAYIMVKDNTGNWVKSQNARGEDILTMIPAEFLGRRIPEWKASVEEGEAVIRRGASIEGTGALNVLWRSCYRKSEAIAKIVEKNHPFRVTAIPVETATYDPDHTGDVERRGKLATLQTRNVYSAEWV